LIGAMGKGDIGKHFPDNDNVFKGISSLKLLEKVRLLLEEENYKICNIDSTIIAQKPKMADYIQSMRKKISETLLINVDQINIKATTEEKLGFTGSGQGISSQSVCLIQKNN